MIKIKFLGAAGTVTGSKFLLTLDHYKVLIDCGLFQGIKYLRSLNRDPLPVNISEIDSVLLTHAHLDHSGYLPLLVKSGYKNEIYMTGPTQQLAAIVLKDSAKIQEEDADKANREGYSKHSPALPLYTEKEVEACFKQFRVVEPESWVSLDEKIQFRYRKNGHILGSCYLEIAYDGKIFVFSGDVGRKETLVLEKPLTPERADVLVVESTYGNRVHKKTSPEDELCDIIHEAIENKGNILISSFAIGRAQELMVVLQRLKKQKRIPDIPIYLDSPMSSEATKVLFQNPHWHKLSYEECLAIAEDVFFVKTVEDSTAVMNIPGSKIVIAASGMLAGGRILNYLKEYIEDARNTILLVGYQAEGTRGKALKDGAEEIKIHGQYYKVKAGVRELNTLSAHADKEELIDWVKNIKTPPAYVFLVHGENDALHALHSTIKKQLGWNAIIPSLHDEVNLF
ncbi:MAG TPA: MBL fold metallo-hydrolase [Cytophagaceae bacterium]